MDLSKLTRLLNIYENEPGLAMPPIQVFATLFALSSPSYSTGLFKVLHGRPIIYLNHLVEKCGEKAEKLGMSVNEEFKHNVGNIPVDAPQAASLISSALDEFRTRYGSKHQAKIQQWIRESFDDLLPPLKPRDRERGAEMFKEMAQNQHYQEKSGFREIVDKQVISLQSESLVTASDFLIKRSSLQLKNAELQLKQADHILETRQHLLASLNDNGLER